MTGACTETFTPGQRDALFVAILDNDDIRVDAELPAIIHFDYADTDLARCFALCRLIWVRHIDREDCIRIAALLSRNQEIGDAEQIHFKHIRARFKHLRFAFSAFDARHRYPPFLDLMTSVMGNLQDAFKNGKTNSAQNNARLWRLLLSRPLFVQLRVEMERFRPSNGANFKAHMQSQMTEIFSFVARPTVSAKEFHDIRKIISRFRACFATINVLMPSPNHDQIAVYLATINGMMGGFHDGLMSEKLNRTLDYHKDRFVLQAEVATRLSRLAKAVTAS